MSHFLAIHMEGKALMMGTIIELPQRVLYHSLVIAYS